jgi:hypothetical protein
MGRPCPNGAFCYHKPCMEKNPDCPAAKAAKCEHGPFWETEFGLACVKCDEFKPPSQLHGQKD